MILFLKYIDSNVCFVLNLDLSVFYQQRTKQSNFFLEKIFQTFISSFVFHEVFIERSQRKMLFFVVFIDQPKSHGSKTILGWSIVTYSQIS